MKKRYWHYTTEPALMSIIKDQEIKMADKYVLGNEIPGVWFSTNPVWEETARKQIEDVETGELSNGLSKNELLKAGFVPVRIEINPELVSLRKWKNHKKKGGISKKVAKGLEDVAKEFGADPNEWYVSYKPVPITSFLFPIQIWNGNDWVDFVKLKEEK